MLSAIMQTQQLITQELCFEVFQVSNDLIFCITRDVLSHFDLVGYHAIIIIIHNSYSRPQSQRKVGVMIIYCVHHHSSKKCRQKLIHFTLHTTAIPVTVTSSTTSLCSSAVLLEIGIPFLVMNRTHGKVVIAVQTKLTFLLLSLHFYC